MPFVRDPLQIQELTVESINRVLARIQDYVDEMKGLRNNIVVHDVVISEEGGFQVKDENGTVIHSFTVGE